MAIEHLIVAAKPENRHSAATKLTLHATLDWRSLASSKALWNEKEFALSQQSLLQEPNRDWTLRQSQRRARATRGSANDWPRSGAGVVERPRRESQGETPIVCESGGNPSCAAVVPANRGGFARNVVLQV